MTTELVNIFGNDEMVCDTARVSLGKQANQYTKEQNNKLIDYLARHNHWSPFAHPQIQFRIECPIYVERQLFKTQVGVSINSKSGRYTDFKDSYSRIKEWRQQSSNIKQGSDGLIEKQDLASYIESEIITITQEAYNKLLAMGVCKEQARTILPLNLNTEFIWTGSLFAFIRLCKQRLNSHAQAETREVVLSMLNNLIKYNCFEQSLKSWGVVNIGA